MEQNVQYTRRKYQESKIEPIMAVDEVLHCGLVNIQSVGNIKLLISEILLMRLNLIYSC